MAPKLKRAEVNASVHICSRTLTGDFSAAIQVATHHRIQLIYPKSHLNIPEWAEELRVETLVGFGIDPKLYRVLIHEMTPANQPCPRGQELKCLKDTALDQIATGPYEIHFVLQDGVKAPSVDKLREWQQHYAAAAADPAPIPTKHIFTLCQPGRNHIARIAVDDLKTPPEGDVERTLRHGLGLTSTQEVMKHNLGMAFKTKLVNKEVKFHLNGEGCTDLKDIEDLTTIALLPSNVVKVHVSPSSGIGSLAMGDGGDDEDEETDED